MHRLHRFTLQVTSMQDSTLIILFLNQTKLLVKYKKLNSRIHKSLLFWSTWLSLSLSSYRKLGQLNNPSPSKDQAKHDQDSGLSREVSELSLQDSMKELSANALGIHNMIADLFLQNMGIYKMFTVISCLLWVRRMMETSGLSYE